MSREQITKVELMKRFGETPKQIERYVAEGMPCEGRSRAMRYPWPEVRRWRDERRDRMARDAVLRTQPTDIDEAKRRKELALAEKAELEVQQLRGESISLEVHEQRVESLLSPLAARCRGLDRYIADVQRATTAVESKAVLDRVSDALLLTLSGVADELEVADDEPSESESDAA